MISRILASFFFEVGVLPVEGAGETAREEPTPPTFCLCSVGLRTLAAGAPARAQSTISTKSCSLLTAWESKSSHGLSVAAWAQGSTQSCSPLCKSPSDLRALKDLHPSRVWMPNGARTPHGNSCSPAPTLEGT